MRRERKCLESRFLLGVGQVDSHHSKNSDLLSLRGESTVHTCDKRIKPNKQGKQCRDHIHHLSAKRKREG